MRVSTLWPVGIIVSVSNAAVTGYANWDDAPAKNFIYIVPDGYGVASQVMARDYASLLKNGENPAQPKTYQLPADELVRSDSWCSWISGSMSNAEKRTARRHGQDAVFRQIDHRFRRGGHGL